MPYTLPVFKKMSPLLAVTDIKRAIAFYTGKLGFSLEFTYEDFYAGIIKDGHSIHLKAGDFVEGPGRSTDELDITFYVDNIEGLYEALLDRSVDIVQPLREMPYGREFYIADPDGNRISFLE
jgi:catechol 2,3-dioxygenase-like lactoylglutathione lyase family enzyme